MATDEELKVTFSAEALIHTMLRDLAQRAFDDYGIKITSANFDWLMNSSVDGFNFSVKSVDMSSTIYGTIEKK